MPVLTCPSCQRTNPEAATYCYFDGQALRAHAGAGAAQKLPAEFAFPSGRRCRTFDELAQAIQEEWAAAREMLQRGAFAQYFAAHGRLDLVRAIEEARAQSQPDLALTSFANALPGKRAQSPRLDVQPRRLLLGTVLVGETRQVQVTLSNQGQGTLQGTVAVTEGQDWLSLSDSKPLHEAPVSAPRQQALTLHVKTAGVAAGQTYGAKLIVATNGGVVELPLRLDVAARPFTKAPFQGVRTQRELAERMRAQPKAGVPLLESGEVKHWFDQNGWTYPVAGAEVKGVAVVQQFFEALGLSKPPAVKLSQAEVQLRCQYPQSVRHQVSLQTGQKKWVYAQVSSDAAWLKVPNPHVSGPQNAPVPLEVDTKLWDGGPTGEGRLKLVANGGQTLSLRVIVEVQGAPARRAARFAAAGAGGRLIPAVVTMTLAFFLLRLLMVLFVDAGGRAGVVQAAGAKLGFDTAAGSDAAATGGWLKLPWPAILVGGSTTFSADFFQPGSTETISASDFRHYFASYFVRSVVLRTWWLGALLGALLVWRRGGGAVDLLFGLVAGAVAGLIAAATLACVALVLETVPHAIWWYILGGHGGNFAWWLVWVVLALICWTAAGFALGLAGWALPPLRRLAVNPFQGALAGLFRLCRLGGLADWWATA